MIVLCCCVELYCVVCSDEAIEEAHDELTRVRDAVGAWEFWYDSERESGERAVIEAAELWKQLATLKK